MGAALTWICAAALGILCAAVLLLISSEPLSSALVVLAVVLGLACLPIAGYFPGLIEKSVLFALAATLSISLKKHLVFRADHMGGAIGIRISITAILGALLLIVILFRRKKNRTLSIKVEKSLLAAYLVFLGLATLSAVFGHDRELGIFQLAEIVQAFVLFLFLRNYLVNERRYKIFVVGLLVGLSLQAAVALVQVERPGTLNLTALGAGEQENIEENGKLIIPNVDVGTIILQGQEQERPTGLLIHPNVLAIYFVLLIPIGIATVLISRFSWLRALGAVAVGFSTVALYFTLSRSGWVGMAGAVFLAVILWLLWKPFSLSFGKKLLIVVVFSALAIGVALKAHRIYERWSETLDAAVDFRISLAETAWNMVKAHPFLGVGLNSFDTVALQYDKSTQSRLKVFPVHNILLLEMSETGLLGGAMFIVLWFVAFRSMVRSVRHARNDFARIVGLFSICGIAGFFLADMSGFSYRVPIVTSMVWAQVALAMCAGDITQGTSTTDVGAAGNLTEGSQSYDQV